MSRRSMRPPPRPEVVAAASDDSPPDESGWVRWEITHDQLGHETRAHAGSFNDYDDDGDVSSFSELYGGHMAVSTTDPGVASADAEGRFVMRFPEGTCESHVAMLLTSTADEYLLKVELTTSESGEQRWGRSWNLTFPRDLQ